MLLINFKINDRPMKNTVKTISIAVLSSLLAVVIYSGISGHFDSGKPEGNKGELTSGTEEIPQYRLTSYSSAPGIEEDSFIKAAEKTVHGVVHVKVKGEVESYYYNPLYEFFYGEPMKKSRPVTGFGSGVIVTPNGYIITNNHVINNAKEIEVVLNDKRTFDASLVGADPSTDIAVLKIDAKKEDLPYITYGNSDELRVGQWVLAVGNPYMLTSTVTAGIVSAKGRNLSLLKKDMGIESFIQTDAALNPGNSGGALVDLDGELVGINTAILSPSGAYSGNSFAVPVAIVEKVVKDMIEFGEVQRAILGISIENIEDAIKADKVKMDKPKGVYVAGVKEDGAAEKAGIKKDDVIIKVNDVEVNSVGEIQEEIARYRPNDDVSVVVLRDGKEKEFKVTLMNIYGGMEIVKTNEVVSLLGADFRNVPMDIKKRLNIKNGVQVAKVNDGKIKSAGIKEGFIILKINDQSVTNVDEMEKIIKKISGGVYIEGISPAGYVAYYAFGL
jgi:Do/DeqQ family serine protease